MSFLAKITAERRADAELRRASGALDEAEASVRDAPSPRDLAAALRAPGLSLIAEIKRASPAKGLIAPDADAAVLAEAFEAGGAAALSVLTEPDHFHGSLQDLRAARAASTLPVLRKDFICDPLHVVEARAAGADAVLLIVAALGQEELRSLIALAHRLGMSADVEVHEAAEVERAVEAGAQIVAINARNLATLHVDLDVVVKVRPLIPHGIAVVAESGIDSRDDVKRMEAAGVDAVHIGEALMRATDPTNAIRVLLGR